jgi:magnesium-transporting ATPase (P-type)
VEDKIVGDPMEVAALKGIGWSLSKEGNAQPSRGGVEAYRAKVLQRFHFSAALKRMSTVVMLQNNRNTMFSVVAKGAPEVLKQHMNPKQVCCYCIALLRLLPVECVACMRYNDLHAERDQTPVASCQLRSSVQTLFTNRCSSDCSGLQDSGGK